MRFSLSRMLKMLRFTEGSISAGLVHTDDFGGNTETGDGILCVPMYVQINGLLVEVWGADIRYKRDSSPEEIVLKLKGDRG